MSPILLYEHPLSPYAQKVRILLREKGLAFEARQYEEAIRALDHLTTIYRWDYYYLAAALSHLNRIERSRSCAAEILQHTRAQVTSLGTILQQSCYHLAGLERITVC